MSKNFQFQLNGVTFKLPSKFLRTHGWGGQKLPTPTIYMDHVATASVLKQWVKAKFPNVVVSSASDSFSGGNSAKIYLSDEMGNEVDKSIYDEVYSFARSFQMGSFNGMIDLYEYSKDRDMVTDNGTPMDISTKWVSVQNGAKWGTLPDVIRMLREMTTTEKYVFGKVSLERAIEEIKSYSISQTLINKAVVALG